MKCDMFGFHGEQRGETGLMFVRIPLCVVWLCSNSSNTCSPKAAL